MKNKIFFLSAFFIFLFNLIPTNAYAKETAFIASAKINFMLPEEENDNRVQILSNYLSAQGSPLTPYAYEFIRYADLYDLDWRFVAAIAGLESTFGKEIPTNSYNAWGWGIFGDNVIYFKSWEDGIATISQGLREKYINAWGAGNIYAIGNLYAASPTWAQRVSNIMVRIEDFSLRSPKSTLSLSL